jgi:thiol-disulfide isomerase/thioredoxin
MRWIAGILTVSALAACGKKETPPGTVDFTVQDLNGNRVSLSEYHGKTVLLNIWATWCKPCIHEIPDLKAIYEEHKGNDLVVLGVLLESGSPDKAKPAVEALKINYPVWYGDDAFARQFEVQAFPTTVIIDKEGRIVRTMIGMQTRERFLRALREAGL